MSESFFEKKEPGRKLDPETEILITSGANEGIFSILLAFVQEQDEVIFFEREFSDASVQSEMWCRRVYD